MVRDPNYVDELPAGAAPQSTQLDNRVIPART
jgi:hypothetical protein